MKKICLLLALAVSFCFAGDIEENEVAKKEEFEKAVQACDGGNASSCVTVGVLYYLGKGVKKDDAEALEYHQKGCDGGDAFGCISLGRSYANGQNVKQDFSKAKEYYEKAQKYWQKDCDDGKTIGCLSLARLYDKGKLACEGSKLVRCFHIVAKDHSQAKKYLDKACDLGMADACNDNYLKPKKCGGGVEIPNLSN
jgi:TPR repeat protein